MNYIVISGNLTADPEVREVGQEKKRVAVFTIANNRIINGEKRAMFVNCEAWGNTCDYVCKRAVKGTHVVLSGELDIRTVNSGNVPKTYTKIVVREFTASNSANSANGAPAEPAIKPEELPKIDDDDMPF